jgi:hypothetical protein
MSIAGTEENELFSSLIGVSAENLVKVKEAFGTKKYNSLTGTGPSLFNFYVAYPKDLFGWYKGELNDELLARMQAVWDPTGLKLKDRSMKINSSLLVLILVIVYLYRDELKERMDAFLAAKKTKPTGSASRAKACS